MTKSSVAANGVGTALVAELGLKITKTEGHDLAGPCVHCKSSDAFRVHQDTGVAYCYSCDSKWSPFRLAEDVLGNCDAAKTLMIKLGVMQPKTGSKSQSGGKPAKRENPIDVIAREKRVSSKALKAYGAERMGTYKIRLPAYGPDGAKCSAMELFVGGGKGKWVYGRPAGLFFPHDSNGVRLPKPGETWHLPEGPKDPAALYDLGLLAAGLNTCRLAAKFARLFAGVDVILIPDRDSAGEKGAKHSTRVLRGVANSVRIVTLPAEFKESGGDDVRDILSQKDGRKLLEQAITDAKQVDESNDPEEEVSASVAIAEDDYLTLKVAPIYGKAQRLVIATNGECTHRDRINTDSHISRTRFLNTLAEKLNVDRDVLDVQVEPLLTALGSQTEKQDKRRSTSDGDDEKSQATMAVEIVDGWETWHTPGKDAYATIPIDDHEETWSLKSQTFKQYLAKKFYEEHETAIGSAALSSAIGVIEAKALFDGDEHEIHVRVGEHDGNVYVDLCDGAWRVLEITSSGWRIIDESPIKFRRSRGMLQLPEPQQGGMIEELRTFLNVDDANWPLVVAWLIGCFRPRGPYPVLALVAEQGAGKSTTGRILRELVDPNSAPLRAEPRDGRDLMIAANNSRCLCFDNLSTIPSWLSDALCRLSTGGGYATRELYSDMDEVIFDLQRPVLLTSIEDVATRSDLLDRCLIVWLSAIPQDSRRTEAEMIAAFKTARPRIFGAILDAVAGALRDVPNTKLSELPRMADFALWVTAAEKAMAWQPDTFLSAYRGNCESANDLALESSPVGRPLMDLLEKKGEWCGTSAELLGKLESQVDDQTKRQKSWPKNARSMSSHLKRLSPNLRASGWDVEYNREASRRLWTIERHQSPEPPSVPASTFEPDPDSAAECDPMQSDVNSYDHLFDNSDDGYDANYEAYWENAEPNEDREYDNSF